MARPLTRAQALQNRAFLKALRRTGNVRLACRVAGAKYGTMQHRRRVHPAFALRWDASAAFAQACFSSVKGPNAKRDFRLCGNDEKGGFRTSGGEMVICRRNDGKLQMRRAQPGKLTRECEQAFLAALSATANVTLSAAAAGASPRAFYRRKQQCPAFARELRLALKRGYEALEMALLESMLPASHEHDDWRRNDPPATPPMSVNQALQLMYLHQKAALLIDEPTPMRRHRGESREACLERLTQMAEARDRRVREEFEIAEAERRERGEPAWGPAGEALRQAQDRDVRARLGLPDLAQVTGWSRADPDKQAHDPEVALFGGWRIGEMEEELEGRGWDWEL
ncbi:MAG: hypothetical protein ACJ8FS_05065 [Sphingomicrobium sp.]